MKALSLFLTIAFTHSLSMASTADICADKAESYLVNVGNTSPAILMAETAEGNLVYEVRANQNGGDAAFEVIVDSQCNLISTRNLWSE